MDTHPCINNQIMFRGINGDNIATYIKLCDGSYFGGNVDKNGPDHEPHVWHHLNSMLAMLAKVLDMGTDNMPCTVCSVDVPPVVIAKHMNAEIIAKIFQCTTDQVMRYFGITITVVKT
jgi:hypothetical protein